MHSSLIGKVEKANRYARELDRITIDRLALTFRGDNDTHHVSLDAGQWHCTCHYFDSWQTCVHVLTLQKIMGVMLPEECPGIDLLRRGCRSRLTRPARARRYRTSRASTGSAPFGCRPLQFSQPIDTPTSPGIWNAAADRHEPSIIARISRIAPVSSRRTTARR